MTKIDYRVIKVPLGDTRQATAILSAYGAEGWDAYHALQQNQDVVIFLKREVLGYAGPREKREPEEEPKRGPGRPRKDVTPSLPVEVVS